MGDRRIVVIAVIATAAIALLAYVLLFMTADSPSRDWEIVGLPLPDDPGSVSEYRIIDATLDSDGVSYVFVNWYFGMAVGSDGEWDLVEFESPAEKPSRGVRYTVDGEGKLHFVQHLELDRLHGIYYGTNSSGTWTLEFVDNITRPDTGGWAAPKPKIAVDSSGAAHLCYYSLAEGHRVRYATNAGGAWEATEIGSATGSEGTDSLALDANGEPHICYWNYEETELVYLSKQGGTWTSEVVDDGWDYVGSVAVCVTEDGTVRIVYGTIEVNPDGKNLGTVQCATRNGDSWDLSRIDESRDHWMRSVSAQTDSSGNVHAAYYKVADLNHAYVASEGDIMYASDEEGSWSVQKIGTVGMSIGGVACALCVDPDDRVHIAYHGSTTVDYAVGTPVGLIAGADIMDPGSVPLAPVRQQ